MGENRTVMVLLTIPMDRAHVNMVGGMINSSHDSEPIVISTGIGSSDAFVQHVVYGDEAIAAWRKGS